MTYKNDMPNTKKRILEAADRLFYRQGYRNTGINQLIDEAEVAKASFYSNFSSKKKLLTSYLEQRHIDWFENLHQVTDKYDHPKEKIFALFEYLEIWITETNYRGCAFININTEFPDGTGEISLIVQEHKQKLRSLIRNLTLSLGKENRSDEELILLSDTIYLIFEGAIVECQNYRELWPVEQSLKAVKKLT